MRGTGWIFLAVLLLFAGCGDMDTLVSSTAAYRISAKLNGVSIDECGVVPAGSEIRPWFVNSVTDDPDVVGLLVWIQDSEGRIRGKKTRYVLATPPRTEREGAGSLWGRSVLDESAPEILFPEDGVPENPFSEDPDAALPDPDGSVDGTAGGSAGGSASDPESSTPAASPETGPPGDPVVETITLSRFDGELPAISFPDELPPGRWSLVFEVLGQRGVLYRAVRTIFSLDRETLNLDEIAWYRPEAGERSIVSPGSRLLLEARATASSGLDPWIVWYSGGKKIDEGSLRGHARIFWVTPDAAGFQTIRAELFPCDPGAKNSGARGFRREISIPVSSRQNAASRNSASGASGTLSLWHLDARLEGESFPSGPAAPLVALSGQDPLWLPAGQIYGLGTGPDHAWLLPPTLWKPPETAGTPEITIVFSPLEDGVLFSGSFVLADQAADHRLFAEISLENGALVLAWSSGDLSGTETLRLRNRVSLEPPHCTLRFPSGPDGCSVALDLPERFVEAALPEIPAPGDETFPSRPLIPGALSGTGIFCLGRSIGAPASSGGSTAESSPFPRGISGPEAEGAPSITFIIDEIIVSWGPPVAPSAPEEVPEEPEADLSGSADPDSSGETEPGGTDPDAAEPGAAAQKQSGDAEGDAATAPGEAAGGDAAAGTLPNHPANASAGNGDAGPGGTVPVRSGSAAAGSGGALNGEAGSSTTGSSTTGNGDTGNGAPGAEAVPGTAGRGGVPPLRSGGTAASAEPVSGRGGTVPKQSGSAAPGTALRGRVLPVQSGNAAPGNDDTGSEAAPGTAGRGGALPVRSGAAVTGTGGAGKGEAVPDDTVAGDAAPPGAVPEHSGRKAGKDAVPELSGGVANSGAENTGAGNGATGGGETGGGEEAVDSESP